MSEEEKPTEEAPAEATAEPEKAPDPASKSECPSAPTGEHDMFHNEGTDETYCRYCGKT